MGQGKPNPFSRAPTFKRVIEWREAESRATDENETAGDAEGVPGYFPSSSQSPARGLVHRAEEGQGWIGFERAKVVFGAIDRAEIQGRGGKGVQGSS